MFAYVLAREPREQIPRDLCQVPKIVAYSTFQVPVKNRAAKQEYILVKSKSGRLSDHPEE